MTSGKIPTWLAFNQRHSGLLDDRVGNHRSQCISEHNKRVLDASRWLLVQEGSKPGILAKLILWVTGKSNINRLNHDLVGWSWVPHSFSWVEPTSYALTALKKVRRLALTGKRKRKNPARRGDDLRSHVQRRRLELWQFQSPGLRALALSGYYRVALIALQDRAGEQANQESLQACEKSREKRIQVWLRPGPPYVSAFMVKLRDLAKARGENFRETGFLGETKTLALALLALNGKSNPFRI